MAERKKPETSEDLQADIEGHPDRGIIDGRKVVDDSRREIRGTISAESKRKFLRVIACYGMSMNEGLQMAVSALWRQEQEVVQNHEREKAAEFGVTQKEIQIKEFGYYKARGRAKRLNLMGGENE
jgi:iron only hydrogenase large subunit-like protein